ncbi:uncharacterized protein BP01DRAFT_329224 [Aspergillus saccharolyticus JOP 1030-1]|uniref:Uncharacterized protein n=1 Tax=Aspergillus saccharolyticus JOP 1030-1 TaxID=1450539 RepID=A0A318Z1F5_9EURO|nr:hypothetical protein BP01DRAFT_329224 [Aspergillus saccharolyticus JOP 1030-1]PYH40749.1 hypothetical protein BP01DRAFT_329224 [Aspergillus saccharolyticus JOP 1030-1]
MLKPQVRRHLLAPRRRFDLRSVPYYFTPRRHLEPSAKKKSPYFESTASQLLRFALTGTTRRPEYDVSESSLDLHLLQSLQNKWPASSLPAPFLATLLRDPDRHVPMPSRLDTRQIRGLSDLQVFIDNNVVDRRGCRVLQSQQCVPLARALQHCQRQNHFGEVLSAINGIVTRVERIDGRCSQRLYVLGMYYSALALSASGLRRYLQGYLAVNSEPLSPTESALLVHAILDSLEYLEFCEDHQSLSAITGLVTGENQPNNNRLHDILYWAKPKHLDEWIGSYFTLLVRLRCETLQESVWAHLIENLSPESHESHLRAAYKCVEIAIKMGDMQRAMTFLRLISEHANRSLRHISKVKTLCWFLPADEFQTVPLGGEEHIEILHQILSDMEARLGIQWQPHLLKHSSASDPLVINNDQPILTMDGSSVGYDSIERLRATIYSFGCSKSRADLGQIADCLNDHDGSLISVSVACDADTDSEYAWCPQLSPFEVSDSISPIDVDFSRPWAPSTLGLLRVSLNNDGQCSAGNRSLHLMQLGFLVARRKSYQEQSRHNAHDWEKTGHIFAWDRFHGHFVAVFVGEVHGATKQCIEARPSDLRFGLKPIIRFSSVGSLPAHWSRNRVTPIGDCAMRYFLHVDPSPDLLP